MHKFVELAKLATENYALSGKMIKVPDDFPAEYLKNKAGAFVTIMKNGQLRGCIGTYLPTKENIAKEIIENAILASTEDWRFGPIKKSELNELSFEVSVLEKPEFISEASPDDWKSNQFNSNLRNELNPKKFGIIVKSRGFISGSDTIFDPAPKPYQKCGLLLPDLEGIDNFEEQIMIACQKGGINPAKETIIIYKFLTKKYL